MKHDILSVATDLKKKGFREDGKRVKAAYEKKILESQPEYQFVSSVTVMWRSFIENRKNKITSSTFANEINAVVSLETFLQTKKNPHILTENFTYDHLQKFESFMRDVLSPNTVARRIKYFKSFLRYYRLRLKGHLAFDLDDVTYEEKPGVRISLTEDELTALQNFSLTGRKAEIRDLFVLQCNTGLRISDLKRVDKNISGNKIKLKSQKSDKDIEIPISPTIREILERYNYALPRVPDQKINEGIKLIFQDACPESIHQIKDRKTNTFQTFPKWEIISSHDAIRTFITLSANRGMSVHSIAQITGKTVEILLKHYLVNSQKVAETEFEKAWGVSPLKIAR